MGAGGDDPVVRADDGRDDRVHDDRVDGGGVCDEPDCDRAAAVRLHVPWAEDRAVCPPHARVLARPDGVVAEPIEGAEEEWP